jgi:hypothetical protein
MNRVTAEVLQQRTVIVPQDNFINHGGLINQLLWLNEA